MRLIESSENMGDDSWYIDNPQISKEGLYANAALQYIFFT